LFTEGHDALGVPPGDVVALSRAVSQLVANPALRERLGRNGRVTVVKRFDRERLGVEVLAGYHRFSGGVS
jgi:glycosyltransferase involved in cell wall biosynthesis